MRTRITSTFKQAAARVGKRLPARAVRAPYTVALAGISRLIALAFPGARVWARNSYLTPEFSPGQSDLDLTALLDASMGQRDWKRLGVLLRRARLLFPWLGEMNAYTSADLALLKPLFNSLELERDPRLMSELGERERLFQHRVEAAVFLSRMLERDATHLMTEPASRAGKWASHLRASDCPPITGPDIRRHVLSCVFDLLDGPSAERAAFLSALGAHLDRAARGIEPDYAKGGDPWLHTLYFNRFCGSRPERPLSPLQREAIFAQAAWECWGLASQRHALGQDRSVMPHVARIEEALSDVELPGLAPQRVRHGLESLGKSLGFGRGGG